MSVSAHSFAAGSTQTVDASRPISASRPLRGSARPLRVRLKRWLVHAALVCICAAAIVPFAWMLLTSVKTLENAMRYPPQIVPDPFVPSNYLDVLRNTRLNFLLWTRNSLIVAVLVVGGTTLSSALVAYGFARLRFPGRRLLFGVMLATMMVPFPVTMVSLFSIFRWLDDHTGVQWLGTFKPLWVPAWFGSAFSI